MEHNTYYKERKPNIALYFASYCMINQQLELFPEVLESIALPNILFPLMQRFWWFGYLLFTLLQRLHISKHI